VALRAARRNHRAGEKTCCRSWRVINMRSCGGDNVARMASLNAYGDIVQRRRAAAEGDQKRVKQNASRAQRHVNSAPRSSRYLASTRSYKRRRYKCRAGADIIAQLWRTSHINARNARLARAPRHHISFVLMAPRGAALGSLRRGACFIARRPSAPLRSTRRQYRCAHNAAFVATRKP